MGSRRLAYLRSQYDRVTSTGLDAGVIALALFIGVYALQASDADAADAKEILYVVPIALLAVRFGLRGGLAGALTGLALIGAWDWHSQDFNLTFGGYLSWGLGFLLLGVLLGA